MDGKSGTISRQKEHHDFFQKINTLTTVQRTYCCIKQTFRDQSSTFFDGDF